ncbi:MAG: FoF1 ATP synthase subunit a, partial [Oscillospiraceae bacterium]
MTIDNVQIHGPKVLFTLPIFGGLDFNETVVNSWIIIAVVFVLCKVLTHKLEKVPTKRTQQIAEIIVTTIDKLVLSTMGKRNMKFAPYILTLMIYSVFGSLIGLVGLRSVTSDLCATLTWGVVTFLLIHISGIKAHGLKHFKGLIEPIPLLLPINILSEVATPVSMGLRHFCNIIAGSIITTLLYAALATA